MGLVRDCDHCDGTGGERDATDKFYVICHTCQGEGKVADDTEYGPYFWLGWNMEVAAAMTIVKSVGYHEGFENGRAIKSLAEPQLTQEERACLPA